MMLKCVKKLTKVVLCCEVARQYLASSYWTQREKFNLLPLQGIGASVALYLSWRRRCKYIQSKIRKNIAFTVFLLHFSTLVPIGFKSSLNELFTNKDSNVIIKRKQC